MITIDLTGIKLKLKKDAGKTHVFDPVRKKWFVLTPEEHVRQYILAYLIQNLYYPVSLIAVEKKIMVGSLPKRYDIVVYNNLHNPWMLIECKAPEINITDTSLHQLLQYHSAIQCTYWVLFNGRQMFCANAIDQNKITWLDALPAYSL